MTKTVKQEYKKQIKKMVGGDVILITYLNESFNIIKRYTLDFDVMNSSDPQSSTVRVKNGLDALNSIIDWDGRLSK